MSLEIKGDREPNMYPVELYVPISYAKKKKSNC